LQVDEISRSIQIVQIDDTALQILNPDARTLLKAVIFRTILIRKTIIKCTDE
jgi:hypothetical protein